MRILEKLRGMGQNNKIVLKNVFFAFLIKGGALLLSLFTTPAFIKYFGDNGVLGVWYTLLSVLTWFLSFDLGVGNGVRNNLVKELSAKDYDSARRTVSSGLFSTLGITVALAAVGVGAIFLVDLKWLYGITDGSVSYGALLTATLIVFAGILARFFLTTVSSVFYALQMSAVNNFLALCVSALQLVFVLAFRFDNPEKSLVALAIAYAIISNLPTAVAGVIVFFTKLKNCRPSFRFVDKAHIKAVLGIGSVFFLCQILYMLIISTNEFLITNVFGPQYTTEYTFYYKLTSIIAMLVTLAMTPVWSVITKAMAEKDYAWLSKLYGYAKLFGLAAAVLQFAFILVQQPVMDIWLREESIRIHYPTAIAFACFGSCFVYSSILSTIVCGMARMKLQAIFYGVGVVLKFAGIYLLAGVIGNWNLVVWCNVLVLLPYCIAQQIDLDIHIKKLRLGKIIQ